VYQVGINKGIQLKFFFLFFQKDSSCFPHVCRCGGSTVTDDGFLFLMVTMAPYCCESGFCFKKKSYLAL